MSPLTLGRKSPDAVGNLTSKTDRKGQSIQYVYDALNRLTHKGYPDSTGVDYVYDLVGKIQQVSDSTGTYGFAYDNMGRLIGTTTQYTFLPGVTYTNTYTYDKASNRTGLTAPDGSTTTYAYDTLNRLATLTNSLTGQFGFGYDPLSRRTQLTRPNGINTNYAYDNLSRLLSVLHQAGASTLDGASYTYDNAGNRTAKTNHLNGVTEGYTYDLIYQLTQVTQGAITTESYTYDAVGNRLSSLGVSPYTYNSSNQLTSTPSGSYTYDANGNTLSDASGRQYTWDFDNRLAQLVNPGVGTTIFRYDPLGRRIRKSGPLGTTIYLYDGENVTEELDSGGSLLARYSYGPRTDQPLSELRSGTTSYYAQDAIATTTSLSNVAGALANTYTYDSFGNLTASTGTLANPFRYTGREIDSETGVYFYRARYLDPTAGRFVSEDSSGFHSGTVNFYDYVGNSPLNFNDPTGHEACCQKNIDYGRTELINALNNSQIMGKGVFKKYKKCLLRFPEMQIKCDPKDKGCGHHRDISPGVLSISPLGTMGRKGKCGPVASTFLHELVHECYWEDIYGSNLTDLQQEQEALQAECQLFGYNCACARNPKQCGY
jgi:RHS repeat-associated protein